MAINHAYDKRSLIFITEALLSLGYDFFGLSEAWVTYPTRKLSQEQEWYSITRDIIGKRSWLHALGWSGDAFLLKIGDYIESFDSATATLSAETQMFSRKVESGSQAGLVRFIMLG